MLLTIENLTYQLGQEQGRQITVSGQLAEGSVLVVRGPSGAGKSTLLRILARLQPGLGGEVKLQGTSWRGVAPTVWRTKVHYVAQQPALFEGTVADNLAIPFTTGLAKGKEWSEAKARELLAKLRLPAGLWQQDAKTLSGGEAARLSFVRALLFDPPVLLLDEPTAALDEAARKALYQVLGQWLAKGGRGALLISHNDDYQGLSQVSHLDVGTQ